jgi:hypothetical protein
MSIILLPFKLLAVPAKAILGIVGVFIAAIANAMIVSYIVRALVWNGVFNVGGGVVTISMLVAFILTFMASGSK